MTDVKQIKQNQVCTLYKNEMLENPQLWSDLLKCSSHKAMDYLNLFTQDEIIALIQKSGKSTYIRKTLFAEWLENIADFIAPLDPINITQAHMEKMAAKCEIHEAGLYVESKAYLTFPSYHYEPTYEYVFQYNEQKAQLELSHTKMPDWAYEQRFIKSYDSYKIVTNTVSSYIKAYKSETNIAIEMAKKCILILDKTDRGFLDSEFQRLINNSIRKIVSDLTKLKQYDLLLAIFSKLSPAVAIEEMTVGGKASIFSALTEALPETRSIFSKMLSLTHSDGKRTELKSKIHADTLKSLESKSKSLYLKITEAPQVSASSPMKPSDSNNTMVELSTIEVYDRNNTSIASDETLFWDGMDADEVSTVPFVMSEVIEQDLLVQTSKWSRIASRNKELAYQYIAAFSHIQAETFVSKASTGTLIELISLITNHNDHPFTLRNNVFKFLKAATPSDRESILSSFNDVQLILLICGDHHELANIIADTITTENAQTLLPNFRINLLNAFLSHGYSYQAKDHYLKSYPYYYFAPNRKFNAAYSLFQKILPEGNHIELNDRDKSIIKRMAIESLTLDDTEFEQFINQHSKQLGMIFSAFTEAELVENQLREKAFRFMLDSSWKALPKENKIHHTAYELLRFLSKDNAPKILPTLRFDLLSALSSGNLYEWAQDLYQMNPTEKIPQKLIDWVNQKVSSRKPHESLSVDKELITAVQALQLKNINASNFFDKVSMDPVGTASFLFAQGDDYTEKLIQAISDSNDERLLEKIIYTFNKHIPLKLLQKIEPNRVLSFTTLHSQKTTQPYIETLFNDLLKNGRLAIMFELTKHVSNVDLWHLHYTIFSQPSFIEKSCSLSMHLTFISMLNDLSDSDAKKISRLYIENLIHDLSFGTIDGSSGFKAFLSKIDSESVCTLKTVTSFNSLMKKNCLDEAKMLYLVNPAYFDEHVDHQLLIRLKSMFSDLNVMTKPSVQPISELDALKVENAALKLKNAALEKQLSQIASGQSSVVLMSQPAFLSKNAEIPPLSSAQSVKPTATNI